MTDGEIYKVAQTAYLSIRLLRMLLKFGIIKLTEEEDSISFFDDIRKYPFLVKGDGDFSLLLNDTELQIVKELIDENR